jgi:hypothetical protein
MSYLVARRQSLKAIRSVALNPWVLISNRRWEKDDVPNVRMSNFLLLYLLSPSVSEKEPLWTIAGRLVELSSNVPKSLSTSWPFNPPRVT